MSRLGFEQAKPKNAKVSQPFDRCQTPAYALTPLWPYLLPEWTIWEPACGEGNLVKTLQQQGFRVEAGDIQNGLNFFGYEPGSWDCQVTNPPFSLDDEWLERSYKFGKPFALLLKTNKLGVGAAIRLFERYGVEVVVPDKRIDFKTINTDFADSNAWFHTSWFTWGLNIGSPLTFARLDKKGNHNQLILPEFGEILC